VGTGMVSRGEVGLIVANVGIGAGLITRDLFSVVVLMVIVTTLVTPVMLRLTFPSAAEESEATSLQ
jgi:Kef-type K+ transport system membrane component KefB